VISAIFLGAFALADSTCGKSTEEPAKENSGPDAPAIALEGIDTGALTQREKKEWSAYVGEFISPCRSVPAPIAQCVKEKRDCDKCAPAAKYIVKLVKDGLTREQVEKAYKDRFDPDKVKTVPVDDSPTKGSPSAPLTVVEFADFQCPHCGEFAPQMDKLIEQRKNDIYFAFKFYVLGKFPNSENAARAAIAAGKQGKLWEMHHLIFADQANLDQAGLDAKAKQLGLDITRLHADMQAPETAAKLAKDHKLGEDLKIDATPTIFINGRQYDGHQDLNEWMNLELSMKGGSGGGAAPSPSPPVSTSAFASADAGGTSSTTKDGGKSGATVNKK
jgi:protein-disulfide isomerase